VDILRRLVLTYESPRSEPWSFDESEPQIRRMLEAIVGFRIEVTRLEGKWKLSQNHPEERRRRVIRALSAQPDADSQAIAELIREDLDRHPDAVGS
jgi:transcriptional regulator